MLLFPFVPGNPETEAAAPGAASGAEDSGGQPVDGAPQVRPEQGAYNRQVRVPSVWFAGFNSQIVEGQKGFVMGAANRLKLNSYMEFLVVHWVGSPLRGLWTRCLLPD
jgi:hypothetical protein